MDPDSLIASLGLPLATFVIALVGAVLPIISIEVFLIGVAVIAGPGEAALLVPLAALGQVLGKLPIYGATRGLTRRSRSLDRARRWFAAYHPTLILAASATLGLPPFSLAATAAGALGIPARTFCVVVGIGRAVRFAGIFALARLW